MGDDLKKKLYDYEADPPGTVWSRISALLDEDNAARFPAALHDLEVVPPDESWNKISKALESSNEGKYAEELYRLEVVPPSSTWQKISSVLDEEKPVAQISSPRKIILIMKYAAAACLIGAVTLGAFKLLNQKTPAAPTALKTELPPKDPVVTVQPSNEEKSSAQINPVPSNNLPKEGASVAINSSSKKRFPVQQAGSMTQLASVSSAVANNSPVNFQQASLKGNIPGNCSLISESDPYLMFMNPDGYLIRISKKLAETLGCFYSNGNSDQYRQCEDQITKWRDKIAQSPASSPDNFLDLIDIIRSVQDN